MLLEDIIDDTYAEHEKLRSTRPPIKRRHTLHSEHENMGDNWDESDEEDASHNV